MVVFKADRILTPDPAWMAQVQGVGDWSARLAEADQPEPLDVLRCQVERGLPCGAEEFLRRLERRVGQLLWARPRGRPKKPED